MSDQNGSPARNHRFKLTPAASHRKLSPVKPITAPLSLTQFPSPAPSTASPLPLYTLRSFTPMPRFLHHLAALTLSAAAQEYHGLTPQEAVKKMTVPPGFKVDLIAAEPDIVQPIAFTFDAKGRIWVVEGNTYPQRAGNPPRARTPASGDLTRPDAAQRKDLFNGKDRVLIFEDKDGDGSFETRKIFIENLNLVSGIELGFGGVYLGAAPYLLHIPDADGDDKPDGTPTILLDGFGWQDTHETLNSFIWGPDGWLYGCHGVFTHSNVGVPPSGGSGNSRAPKPAPGRERQIS